MDGLLRLVLVLGGVGVVLVLVLVGLAAGVILRPPRMGDGKAAWLLKRLSPADLGLGFEEMKFKVRDVRSGGEIGIAGWWIPCAEARGRCVVLVHGYADAKVGGIAWAPLLHRLGWNVLAIDLRAHGESGGEYCTAGFFERHDVDQVINQVQAMRPGETRRVALFGVSLGGAVAAATAVMRNDLVGVILEGPFADFRRAVVRHADLFGMPGGVVPRWAPRVAEWIGRCDFGAVRPVDSIKRVGCPVLVIHAEDDPLMDEVDVGMLEGAMKARGDFDCGKSKLWRVAGAGHVLGMEKEPGEYERVVGGFLAESSQ